MFLTSYRSHELTLAFSSSNEAKRAFLKIQKLIAHYWDGHKIKITKVIKPLQCIKEKPNDSDNQGSDPSSAHHENSGESRSGEERDENDEEEQKYESEINMQYLNSYELDEGKPVVEEVEDDVMNQNKISPSFYFINKAEQYTQSLTEKTPTFLKESNDHMFG